MVAGFVLRQQYTTVSSVLYEDGVGPDGEPVVTEVEVDTVVASATPLLSDGVLFAQGGMWRPSSWPVPPAAPLNALSYLHYNGTTGLYWNSGITPTTAGDALLGWVKCDGYGVIATSSTQLGSGEAETVSVPTGAVLPDDPGLATNVTAIAATVTSGVDAGGDPAAWLAATLTLPLGYSGIDHIDVPATNGAGGTVLVGRITSFGTSMTVNAPLPITQTGTWTLVAVSYNASGVPTPATTGTSTTFTLASLQVYSCVGTDAGSRYLDGQQVTWTHVGCTATFWNNQLPQNESIWLSTDGGSNYDWYQPQFQTTVGQTLTIVKQVPAAAATWKIAMRTGNTPNTGRMTAAALAAAYPDVIFSAGFTVATLSAPSATAITDAGVGVSQVVPLAPGSGYTAGTYTVNASTGGAQISVVCSGGVVQSCTLVKTGLGYNAAPTFSGSFGGGSGATFQVTIGAYTFIDDLGRPEWGIPVVSWTTPGGAEVNGWSTVLTFQAVNSAGVPASAVNGGLEVIVEEFVNDGRLALCTMIEDYGFQPTGDAHYYAQLRVYVFNRLVSGSVPNFQDTTNCVLQTTAWAGAAYGRFRFGPAPTGTLNLRQMATSTIGTGLQPDPATGNLIAVQPGLSILQDPDFARSALGTIQSGITSQWGWGGTSVQITNDGNAWGNYALLEYDGSNVQQVFTVTQSMKLYFSYYLRLWLIGGVTVIVYWVDAQGNSVGSSYLAGASIFSSVDTGWVAYNSLGGFPSPNYIQPPSNAARGIIQMLAAGGVSGHSKGAVAKIVLQARF